MSRARRGSRQRGAVSVELALGIPLLVMVILGGVHFGLVLKTRHELGDAVNYASRAASIRRTADAGMIQAAIQNRLGGSSGCSGLSVSSGAAVDGAGVRRIDVVASCTVDTGVTGGLLFFLGAAEISVRASMPY